MSAFQRLLLASAISAGGGGGGSAVTLNPSDKHADITLSGGNLTAQAATSGAWKSVRATLSRTAGRRYYEVRYVSGASWPIVGCATSALALTTYPGNTGTASVGLYTLSGNRRLYINGTATSWSTTHVAGDYIGYAIDISAGKGWVRTSNLAGWIGGGDPSTGTTPTFTFTAGTAIFPMIGLYDSNTVVTANFGASAFNMAAPLGYASWEAAAENVYSDSFWPYVALLVPFTGTDGVTTATDQTGRHPSAFTFVSSAQIDTGNANHATGALMLDGTDDGVRIGDLLSDFLHGTTQDVTYECWYEARAFAQAQALFSTYAGAPGGLLLAISNGGTGYDTRQGDSAPTIVSRAVTVTANTPHHFAYVRNQSGASGYARIFHNGVKVGADITTHAGITLGRSGQTLGIGSYGITYPSSGEFDGWIKYCRITLAARYWADFTPPSLPLVTT